LLFGILVVILRVFNMVLYTCYRAEEDGHIEQSFIGYAKNEKNETILDFGNTDTFSEFFL